MNDVLLNGHIIVEYPQLGKYTVLFREGGAQNFCRQYDDLPDKLKKVIEETKRRGRVQSFVAASQQCVTKNPDLALDMKGLAINVYSDMF